MNRVKHYSISRRLAITICTLVGLGATAPVLQAAPSTPQPSIDFTLILETAEGMDQRGNTGHEEAPFMLALGRDTRVQRRHDAVENTADRIEDKQDFREERRDCVGEGPGCRSENRQDKREDAVDRAEDRIDDRRDRRWD